MHFEWTYHLASYEHEDERQVKKKNSIELKKSLYLYCQANGRLMLDVDEVFDILIYVLIV